MAEAAPAFTARLTDIDRRRRSPNFGPRAAGFARPICLVLHYTGMADGPSAVERLCDPASQVSCHYLVTETGSICQLVDEGQRAWCCGQSSWQGVTDLNSASVNIEIVNGGHDYGLPEFPDRQVDSVVRLSRDIVERHGIRPAYVLAHSDIAPSRKQDPGERFPWPRLAAEGIGLWAELPGDGRRSLVPGEVGAAVGALQGDLARYGYGLSRSGVYDTASETVIRAFQRHFRPTRIDGIADAETQVRLAGLLDQMVSRS